MYNIKISHDIKLDKDGNFVHSKPIIHGNKDLVENVLNATTFTIKNDKHQFQYNGENFKMNADGTLKWIEKQIEKPFYSLGKVLENDFVYFHTTLEEKKRLPDVVIFKNGKTTLLFSVENNGKPPYTSFSSKVTKVDVFNRELGFLITYLKYLKENNKKFINEIFNYDFTTNELLSYLHGMIRQLIDENGIDFQEFGGYLVDILNNHISTLKEYRDLQKLNKEIENKEKEVENKKKELEKLKKQRGNK